MNRKIISTDGIVAGANLNQPHNSSPNEGLVHWEFSKEDWKRFYSQELRERKLNIIIIGVLIAIISTFLLRNLNTSNWIWAIGTSVLVAFIYCLLSYRLAVISIGKPGLTTNRVIITEKAVLINERLKPFSDEYRRLAEIKIHDDADPKIFEIVCHWNTRKGRGKEIIHVPIPKGKLGEAVLLMEKLKRTNRLTTRSS